MPRWRYIGLHDDVTDCPSRNHLGGVCSDGSCPGKIKGFCRFTSLDTPLANWTDYFMER